MRMTKLEIMRARIAHRKRLDTARRQAKASGVVGRGIELNGQLYRTEFATRGCHGCAFHEPGHGCSDQKGGWAMRALDDSRCSYCTLIYVKAKADVKQAA